MILAKDARNLYLSAWWDRDNNGVGVLAGMNPLGLESVPDANTNGKIDIADALGGLNQARELNQK